MENKNESATSKFKVQIIKRQDVCELISKFNKNVVEDIKSIPKSKYVPATKKWMFSLEHLETFIQKLVGRGFEYDLIEETATEKLRSCVSINFNDKTFLVHFPIPEIIKIKFWNRPKSISSSQWELSDTYFMEFYSACVKNNISLIMN